MTYEIYEGKEWTPLLKQFFHSFSDARLYKEEGLLLGVVRKTPGLRLGAPLARSSSENCLVYDPAHVELGKLEWHDRHACAAHVLHKNLNELVFTGRCVRFTTRDREREEPDDKELEVWIRIKEYKITHTKQPGLHLFSSGWTGTSQVATSTAFLAIRKHVLHQHLALMPTDQQPFNLDKYLDSIQIFSC